jgi:transposase
MAKTIQINVSESILELRKRMKGCSLLQQQKLQMLILLKKGTHTTLVELSQGIGVMGATIHSWRTLYRIKGLDELLLERRGGHKQAQITEKVYLALEQKLSSPTECFISYKQVQDWINEKFGLQMEYHAVNKFIKRKFGARLKVGRKSNVLKDE